jgi:hypothetical protein
LEIASPPVQPAASSRSGIGAVATMSLETATTARVSSGMPAIQAPVARTIAPASTDPDFVLTTPPSRSSSTMGERS